MSARSLAILKKNWNIYILQSNLNSEKQILRVKERKQTGYLCRRNNTGWRGFGEYSLPTLLPCRMKDVDS